ncbi:flagellar biosynthetic protein FliR [Geothermobacter hydrogeniphilus]|uniref:Flagellar biosynthetic protein FliR n=1 Tax=Geothermobacter hydrogeniphilus TaxID=1969733 RepID=A0A2K2HD15_9BACT|nr:flagellar biosynthetic protein FliR [Geothermobacter hydrogeniphilus]PNU21133.1 flagellar biosynthetic protein FliR [Geothermobacter hydrogeniphilus]
MTLPQLSVETIQAFLICLVRVAALIGTLPLYSGGQTPMRVRAGLTVMLTLMIFPLVRSTLPQTSMEPVSLLILLTGEGMFGLMVGYLARFIFTAVELGGTVIGYQMGFAAANVFDPQNQRQVSLISQFQNVLAILIFLSLNIHHYFIRALVNSFEMLPPGHWDFSGGAVPYLLELAGKMFVLGIQLSAPVLAVLLLSGLVLGIMARVFPQLNVFLLSFPLNIGITFLLMGLTLNLMVALLNQEFSDLEQRFRLLFEAL